MPLAALRRDGGEEVRLDKVRTPVRPEGKTAPQSPGSGNPGLDVGEIGMPVLTGSVPSGSMRGGM